MAFRVGQKVVCIKDGSWENQAHPRWIRAKFPTNGQIYTVREIETHVPDGTYLRFMEIDNVGIPTYSGNEICFLQERFRPLVERNTDISIFTAMLTPKHVHENA